MNDVFYHLRVPQQPSILRLTRVLSLPFNESLIKGRHSFGYFSVAVDRKVTCCRSATDAFDFDFAIKQKKYSLFFLATTNRLKHRCPHHNRTTYNRRPLRHFR